MSIREFFNLEWRYIIWHLWNNKINIFLWWIYIYQLFFHVKAQSPFYIIIKKKEKKREKLPQADVKYANSAIEEYFDYILSLLRLDVCTKINSAQITQRDLCIVLTKFLNCIHYFVVCYLRVLITNKMCFI